MSAPAPPGMGLAGSMPEYGLVTIVWIATGLAGCFVVARTAIRIKKIEKLHVDDYIIYAAFLVLVVNAVLQTLQAPHCYNLARLVNGLSTLTEEETMASGNTWSCNKEIDKKISIVAVMYSTTVDVLTDIMIMAMPLQLLWKVRISRSEKMGLAGVFSIGFLIIVIAIARAVQIAFTTTSDSVLLALWGIIESTVYVALGVLVRLNGQLHAITNKVKHTYNPVDDQSHTPAYNMVGITSLPFEILSDILSYLPRKQEDQKLYYAPRYGTPFNHEAYLLPAYTTVCKTWQRHIEMQTFQEIVLMSCELEYWSKIMTESRRSALRVIKYAIVMSQDVNVACSRGKYFGAGIVEVAETAVIAGITDLFVLLKEWEEDGPLMSLSFDIERSFTYNEGQELKMSRLGEQFSSIKDYAFSGLRYITPILQLGSLGGLPTLKSAKTIHFHHMYPICIAPDSMARLAINFSALKILDMKIGSVSSMDRYRGLDPEFRYGYALSLLQLASLPLTHFSLHSSDYIDGKYAHFEEPPSILHYKAPGIDHLSLALYAISITPTIEEMKIYDFIVSPQLFQPPATIPIGSEFAYLANAVPQWPFLKTYYVQFSIMHPSGSWYFVRHPDISLSNNLLAPGHFNDGHEEIFRTYPDDEAMNEMLSAAGKAKRRMPALQILSLFAIIQLAKCPMFEATWCKAGGLHDTDLNNARITTQPFGVSKEAFLAGDRVYWSTGFGRNWHPAREVQEVWTGNGNQRWFKRFSESIDGWLYGGEFF
ncbi:hypothetical protein V498_05744 [Pseudogymnoascus sp. VKM F-4517 (FW-2822)]|nr:hypothetical protein V498_05744 [Pseudogymnoascus sp. VKM F-4517 (FW-2822)]